MDQKERIRRAKNILRTIASEVRATRAAMNIFDLGSPGAADRGGRIAELGANLEDALNDLDLSSERDRRKSRTRKVRRALGYTFP